MGQIVNLPIKKLPAGVYLADIPHIGASY